MEFTNTVCTLHTSQVVCTQLELATESQEQSEILWKNVKGYYLMILRVLSNNTVCFTLNFSLTNMNSADLALRVFFFLTFKVPL